MKRENPPTEVKTNCCDGEREAMKTNLLTAAMAREREMGPRAVGDGICYALRCGRLEAAVTGVGEGEMWRGQLVAARWYGRWRW
ncbi:hypothetical protein E3N88_06476 [Mikania micrantha]|uniref:Uncharacterized protein n=1 Tax=Mikania micrantha TaxID=192012 RepID=A0A5N6PR68_9ASTR|nr:hypothetical protein E3N88_06476 [Mikania micrantha]